jgi:Protein of unknown function with PCYCGC motif
MSKKHAQQSRLSARSILMAFAILIMVATATLIFLTRQPVSGRAPRFVPTGRSDASAVLDPASFQAGQQREAYMAARAIPAVLNQLYCWCHCRESTIFHHRSLLECFESDHASQCKICMGEAALAYKMVQGGTNDVRQIQNAIDAQFGPQSLGST